MQLDYTKKILGASVGLLAMAGLALADDTTSGYTGLETMDQGQVEHVIQINPAFTYTADADFDDSAMGSIKVWRFDIPARYTIKTEHGDLGLGAFYEYSEYDLDNLAGTRDFNTLAFDAVWKGMYDENWGYFVFGGAALSASTDTGLGNGLTGFGGAGVRYVWSEKLSLGVGAAVASRLEDDPSVLPVIALNWQISERWNLRTLNGAILTYDITADKTWQADIGVKYQRREYRLDSDSSVTDKMIMGEAGLTYRFCPQFALRGFFGVAAGRNIEVRQNDNKLGDEDVDAAPFFGVRALCTF